MQDSPAILAGKVRFHGVFDHRSPRRPDRPHDIFHFKIKEYQVIESGPAPVQQEPALRPFIPTGHVAMAKTWPGKDVPPVLLAVIHEENQMPREGRLRFFLAKGFQRRLAIAFF